MYTRSCLSYNLTNHVQDKLMAEQD